MKHSLHAFVGILTLSLASAGHAAISPIGLSILAPVQFPTSDAAVIGVRVNALLSNHRSVYGFDLGVGGNITGVKFGGVQVGGLFNWNRGLSTIVGLQLGGLANVNTGQSTAVGVQVAGLFNSNKAESTVLGLQAAVGANLAAHSTIYGAQIGLYNSARKIVGFQIGLINMADDVRGLQIGLVNIHRHGLFKICPVINFGF